ncbi:hypothetical protein G7046_g1290 [Stylonectria norvegica]|nr:hypothetical protein G7046_g1290 [Stylonectria norvegica]
MHAILLFFLAAATFYWCTSFGTYAVKQWYARRKLLQTKGCKPGRFEQSWDFLGFRKIVLTIRSVLAGSMLEYTDALWEIQGDTYTSNFLGQKVIFTRDASNIKQLLVSRWLDYNAAKGLRTRMFKDVAPGTIADSDGHAWKMLRNNWRAEFASTNNMFDIKLQEEHFRRLIKSIKAGATVDMQSKFRDFVTDVITDLSVGDPVGCLDPEQSADKKSLGESIEFVLNRLAQDGFLGPAAFFLGKKKKHENIAYLHSWVDESVRRRLEAKQSLDDPTTGNEKLCVLDNMMKRTTDTVELRDMILTLMAGANQSVGSILSITVWVLSHNQRVFDKLRSSILDKVGYEPPTNQQMKSFTYLNHVINEVLRLYPPLPFSARLANKDTWLDNGGGPDGTEPLFVKKGQCVFFSIWGTQRNEKYFGDDALSFKPERWETVKVDTAGFMPFSLGPRNCLGQHFAQLEATYIIVRLLQTYSKFENRGGSDFKPEVRLSLLHREGVLVAFTPDPNSVVADRL